MQRDLITVERFYTEHASSLELKLLAGANGLKRFIREPTVNRPGLALAGFTRYFASKRVQVIGNAESHFIKSLPTAERGTRYNTLFSHKIPCFVFCRGFSPDRQFLKMAECEDVPIFDTPQSHEIHQPRHSRTRDDVRPHGSELGSMVDILGVGVIIRGESGIGKSESVLASD